MEMKGDGEEGGRVEGGDGDKGVLTEKGRF